MAKSKRGKGGDGRVKETVNVRVTKAGVHYVKPSDILNSSTGQKEILRTVKSIGTLPPRHGSVAHQP